MPPSFANKLDTLGCWRRQLDSSLQELSSFLRNHDLLAPEIRHLLESLCLRLRDDKMLVAFVGELSRGKSELINALVFADTGRRILPATPGRTTMCPVELGHDPNEPPSLRLLDIEARRQAKSLAELRALPSFWTRVPLEIGKPEQLAAALQRVRETRAVPLATARALGLWSDEDAAGLPPQIKEGLVEVPAWGHAVINYPHPLLQRGLRVLDTPGLNALGAEPDLTLDLLASAQGVVFTLAADAGVTRSDLLVWRNHLEGEALPCLVALNKIDTLRDPLSEPQAVEAQIARQRLQAARALGLPETRVFPLSARQALAARIDGDGEALAASGLPQFEEALLHELLPRRQEMLQHLVQEGLGKIERLLGSRLTEGRRQFTEQLIELRNLRGKNSATLGLVLKRAQAESAEFEQCVAQVQAIRTQHERLLRQILGKLSSEVVRHQAEALQQQLRSSVLNLGAKKAFAAVCAQLRERLKGAQAQSEEIRQMLLASFARINTEFGLGLAAPALPDLRPFLAELDLVERNYARYLGPTQVLRLSQPGFREQFRRMLISRGCGIFEGAAEELERWGGAASSQIDAQLQGRRRHLRRRQDLLERVQQASTDLGERILEVAAQEEGLHELQRGLLQRLQDLRQQAEGAHVPPDPGPRQEMEAATAA